MPRIAASVVYRILAGVIGIAVGIGLYGAFGVLDPAPGAVETPVHMHEKATRILGGPIKFVDSRPASLVIPAINVTATIEARGLDSQHSLETPKDYRDVAWYSLGPRPGDPGNAILNGHVNWWTGDAVFTHLSSLKVGDAIQVVRADGVVVEFRVTGKRVVDAHARIASLFAPSPESTITLITCSGDWNPLTLSDTQRLLVSATHA